VSLPEHGVPCHAWGHDAEMRPGTYGVLCPRCWQRVLAILKRVLGHPSRWAAYGTKMFI
jgi:hypothetical protein